MNCNYYYNNYYNNILLSQYHLSFLIIFVVIESLVLLSFFLDAISSIIIFVVTFDFLTCLNLITVFLTSFIDFESNICLLLVILEIKVNIDIEEFSIKEKRKPRKKVRE